MIEKEKAALEELKLDESSPSGKSRGSNKERSQSPAKTPPRFSESYKMSDKPADETQNSLTDLIDYGSEPSLPKIASQPAFNLDQQDLTDYRESITKDDIQEQIKQKLEVEVLSVKPLQKGQLDFETQQDQEEYFETLFDTPPIPFRRRKGNKLDQAISIIIQDNNFTIPIVNIRDSLFLVGPNRLNCDYKYESVLVKVGGGSQKLEDYLMKNHANMEKTLIDHMAKS